MNASPVRGERSASLKEAAWRARRYAAAALRKLDAKWPSIVEAQPTVMTDRHVDGVESVEFEGDNSVGRGTSFQGGSISIGRGTTLGVGCIVNGPVGIGRYTQLGSYVGIYGVDHPIDLPVPNVNARFLGGAIRALCSVDHVSIGHGCWLGHGVVVLKGVTIGDGAVVGAGSLVTQDIPPYSLAVGSPVSQVRPRFAFELSERLEDARWWEWTPEELESNSDLFLTSFSDTDRAMALLNAIDIEAIHRRGGPEHRG